METEEYGGKGQGLCATTQQVTFSQAFHLTKSSSGGDGAGPIWQSHHSKRGDV